MFRYEVGATILVKRRDDVSKDPVSVQIIAKGTNTISVKVLDNNWFRMGSIQTLTSDNWFSVGRINAESD